MSEVPGFTVGAGCVIGQTQNAETLATESAVQLRERRAKREYLNSERIASRFGNYDINVLAATDRTRVSCLTSTTQGQTTCRTFAVVHYAPLDPAIAAEHAIIVAGGSIAAVFTARGWAVRKTRHRYSNYPATARLAKLMAIPTGTLLAEHAYVLSVGKDDHEVEYATIKETHHPDYLSHADLDAIYGPAFSPSHLAQESRSRVTGIAVNTFHLRKQCCRR